MKSGLERKPTQCTKLVKFIETHGSISTMQAILYLGIVNPAARVMELKKQGVNVITTIKKGFNRFDEPCRYAVYTIKGAVDGKESKTIQA